MKYVTGALQWKWPRASLPFDPALAASQQCLSQTFPNTFSLSEKEKIFNTKAMVTCKRSAGIVKKMTNYDHLALSKKKKQTQVASGLH